MYLWPMNEINAYKWDAFSDSLGYYVILGLKSKGIFECILTFKNIYIQISNSKIISNLLHYRKNVICIADGI